MWCMSPAYQATSHPPSSLSVPSVLKLSKNYLLVPSFLPPAFLKRSMIRQLRKGRHDASHGSSISNHGSIKTSIYRRWWIPYQAAMAATNYGHVPCWYLYIRSLLPFRLTPVRVGFIWSRDYFRLRLVPSWYPLVSICHQKEGPVTGLEKVWFVSLPPVSAVDTEHRECPRDCW